jgi:hypothetical protein
MISAGPSFFSARDRETKKAREREEIKARKGESADHEEKKANSRFFLPLPHSTGNPFPEPKATRQREKQDSSVRCMYVTYKNHFHSWFHNRLFCAGCPVLADLCWPSSPSRLAQAVLC